MENWLYKGRENGGNPVLNGGNPLGFGNPTDLTNGTSLVGLQTERENITENQPDLTELWSVSDSLTRMIVYYDSLLRVVPPADTANIDSILNVLHSELGTIIHSMEVLMQSANDTRLIQSEWLAAQNLSLTLTDVHQQHEQTVNDIYLNTYARGNFLLDSMHRVTLEEIADLCPIVGGPGVFMARSMLSVYGIRVYEDEATCLGQGYTMRQGNQGADEEEHLQSSIDLKVYPNPTSGQVYVKTNFSEKEDLYFMVYDAAQRKVASYRMETGLREYEFTLPETLANGIYFYNVGNLRGKLVLNR